MKKILDDVCLCYGCTACYSICPTAAITMVKNDRGYRIPEINENLCINCGRCNKVCPRLNFNILKKEPKVYAVKNKDEFIRSLSQSGGAFGALCDYVLENKGVVYGCILDNNSCIARHIRVISDKDVFPLHGSKYIQSDLGNCFKDIQNDLSKGLLVLFVGTPCQVAGLKAFIGNKDSNLLTADLVCFGVSSPIIWKEYINQLEQYYKGTCIRAKFRDKKYGWHSHCATIIIQQSNGQQITIKDTTYRNIFMSKLSARDSCFSCQFRSVNRIGDFTLGDCWGIEKTQYKDFADSNGISLLMMNTDKAKAISEIILSKLEYRLFTNNDFLQPALFLQNKVSKLERDKFWACYNNFGASMILWKYGSYQYRIKSIFRRIIGIGMLFRLKR